MTAPPGAEESEDVDMADQPKQMILTTFMLPAGYHKDSWRMPGSRSEELGNLEFVADLTRMAEEAKLHAVFFGDIAHANTVLRGDIKMNGFYEPISTLSALAARTTHIGLVGTVSTAFSHPYNVARQIAGVDHMSGGRAGWNVVTSSDGYRNFGHDSAPEPAERYRRATEFVEVVKALWDSWGDDAVINDRDTGMYADLDKIRKLDFVGEYFSIEGPMPGPRSPQGHPLIAQAGQSGPGVALGSKLGDMIYTAQPLLQPSIEFYAMYKQVVADAGRDPDHVKIIPGILPIIGDTEAEARELADELGSFVNMDLGRKQVGADMRIDLSEIDLDDHIPAEWIPENPNYGTRYGIYRSKALDQGMTVRELIVDLARSTGHQWMAGTAVQIADRMQEWFEVRACDGFNLNAPYNPGGFETMCTKLVPELQNRGLFHEDYTGTTLRENMGLPRPAA